MKLIKFSASWCAPCKQLSTVIGSIKDQLPEVVEVDVEKDFELASKYNIRSVPVLVLEDNDGNFIRRMAGYQSAEKLLEFVKE